MEVVRKIRLNDGSEHSTKQQAERYLYNVLSGGDNVKLFDTLAHKSSLKIKEHFIDNIQEVKNTIKVINELLEVAELKDF